jgi:hypothetical protein
VPGTSILFKVSTTESISKLVLHPFPKADLTEIGTVPLTLKSDPSAASEEHFTFLLSLTTICVPSQTP